MSPVLRLTPAECEPGLRTALWEGVNIRVNIGVNFPVMFPMIFPTMFPIPAHLGCEIAPWRAAQV